jgi:hypothetical protein
MILTLQIVEIALFFNICFFPKPKLENPRAVSKDPAKRNGRQKYFARGPYTGSFPVKL